MTTLYLDRRNARLCVDGRRLLVHEPNSVRPQAFPIALLSRVVIIGPAQLDSSSLLSLGRAGVGVTCLGVRGLSAGRVLTGQGHADGRRRLAQYQVVMDTQRRLDAARALVAAKLRAQLRVQQDWLRSRPNRRKALLAAGSRVTNALSTALSAESAGTLRGAEGAAAAAHFGGLAAMLPPHLGFEGRRRRPPTDPVNAVLSLGYTLLTSDAEMACHQVGLDPILGVYHDLSYGRASLACDLIEPLRPHVDAWAVSLFLDTELRAGHFSNGPHGCSLGKTGRGIFFGRWERAARPWRRWLRMSGYGLAKAWGAALEPLSMADDVS